MDQATLRQKRVKAIKQLQERYKTRYDALWTKTVQCWDAAVVSFEDAPKRNQAEETNLLVGLKPNLHRVSKELESEIETLLEEFDKEIGKILETQLFS